MNKLQIAEQLRKALNWFAQTLGEEQAMEICGVYDAWKPDTAYVTGEYITYGENSVGDAQLYKVVQGHTSQADWTPDVTAALYTPIGLTDDGYPIWAQPTGSHDAYNAGDIVEYNGILYKSLIDGNVYSPDAYPAGWELVEE
ncbi:MAG: hypothetical protein U0K91_11025 [Acutalibacteraceae bacterium]|nr:hypothetical protein [Acutalibacteraceae bacterium]